MKPWTGKKICSIPHNTQVFFTYAEFEAARLLYVNQQRAARIAAGQEE